RAVSSATWTSDEPVSFSWVLYSAMISGLTTVVDMVYWLGFTTVGNPCGLRDTRSPRPKSRLAGVTVPIRRSAGPVMVGIRNRRMSTDARGQIPELAPAAQAKI